MWLAQRRTWGRCRPLSRRARRRTCRPVSRQRRCSGWAVQTRCSRSWKRRGSSQTPSPSRSHACPHGGHTEARRRTRGSRGPRPTTSRSESTRARSASRSAGHTAAATGTRRLNLCCALRALRGRSLGRSPCTRRAVAPCAACARSGAGLCRRRRCGRHRLWRRSSGRGRSRGTLAARRTACLGGSRRHRGRRSRHAWISCITSSTSPRCLRSWKVSCFNPGHTAAFKAVRLPLLRRLGHPSPVYPHAGTMRDLDLMHALSHSTHS